MYIRIDFKMLGKYQQQQQQQRHKPGSNALPKESFKHETKTRRAHITVFRRRGTNFEITKIEQISNKFLSDKFQTYFRVTKFELLRFQLLKVLLLKY